MFKTYAHGNMTEFFTDVLEVTVPGDEQYMNAVDDFLPNFESSLNEIVSCGLVEFWIEKAVFLVEENFGNQTKRRFIALNFLSRLWSQFHEYLDAREAVSNQLLSTIKRATRD